MARAEGKVVFISGVARGQGRNHALRLAEEGANIIGFDLCEDDPAVEYPLATEADLAETIELVEKTGQRIHAVKADVRDKAAVEKVLEDGVAQFGRLDIVLANAGIMPITGQQRLSDDAFYAAVNTMLSGVYHTVRVAIPHIQAGGRGGSIVITSSTNGLVGGDADGSPGLLGYAAAKHGVVGLMRVWTRLLAAERIRVNTVHPTGVASPMVMNEAFGRFVAEYPKIAENLQNPLPVPNGLLDVDDVTNTILHLISDAGQYVTGQTVVVDAGFTAR
jgi:SDR family mycofactocin-dependent oxidoreductase